MDVSTTPALLALTRQQVFELFFQGPVMKKQFKNSLAGLGYRVSDMRFAVRRFWRRCFGRFVWGLCFRSAWRFSGRLGWLRLSFVGFRVRGGSSSALRSLVLCGRLGSSFGGSSRAAVVAAASSTSRGKLCCQAGRRAGRGGLPGKHRPSGKRSG